jgi:hypothetical protein
MRRPGVRPSSAPPKISTTYGKPASLPFFFLLTFDRRLTHRARVGQLFDRRVHRLIHRVRVAFRRPNVTVAEYLSDHNDVDPGVREPRRRRVAQVVKAQDGNPRLMHTIARNLNVI